MKLLSEMMNDLIRDEGLELKPYRCPTGKLTIGVGRNLEDKGISQDEAIYLLRNDITECVEDLRTIFHNFEEFSASRKRALINMRFNLGPSGFRSFKKMIAAIKANDWQTACKEAKNSKWYKQVPTRANRIIKLLMGVE